MYFYRLIQFCVALAIFWASPARADHYEPITVWQTIPFIRGQDLCQYQDAYGRTTSETQAQLTRQLVTLLHAGADPSQLPVLLETIDTLTQRSRERATEGKGMDVLLEGSLKAHLDGLYLRTQPRERNVSFYNPAPLFTLATELRQQQRQGYLDARSLGKLNAIAWGTYSFAPDCRGEVVVTLHLQASSGRNYSYQGVGRPHQVMQPISEKIFAEFQHTMFPSKVSMGKKTLELVGAPGRPISHVRAPAVAVNACSSIGARLPTREEYEYLSSLGDWNKGVRIAGRVWALSSNEVLAPDLPNPSPVREAQEFGSTHEIYYFCVR